MNILRKKIRPSLTIQTPLIPDTEDEVKWLKSLYSLILKRDIADNDEGLIHWIEKIKSGVSRPTIDQYL